MEKAIFKETILLILTFQYLIYI